MASEREPLDPKRAEQQPAPRRVSGSHPKPATTGAKPVASAAKPVSPKPAAASSTKPPIPAIAKPAAPVPAKPVAPPVAPKPVARAASTAEVPVMKPQHAETKTASGAGASQHLSAQGARKRWQGIVAALAVACVLLGAATGWLWLGGSQASEAAAKPVLPAEAPKGDATPVAGASGGTTVPAGQPATARFIGRDDKRSGKWKGVVGKDGHVIFNRNGGGQHEIKLPDFITEVTSTGEHHIWNLPEDPRGLEDPADPKRRHVVCEYSGTEVLLTLKCSRPTPYRLSIYAVDPDTQARRQRVEVMDCEKVLHAQEIAEMTKGTWLEYELSGSVEIKLTNLSELNAVVAGLFFDVPENQKIAKREPVKGAPPDSAGQLQPGVWVEYFDRLPVYPNVADRPTVRRAETRLVFGATQPLQPGQGLRNWPLSGACAAIFSGFLKIAEDGPHTFFVESDDGARLYLDGELLVDNDGRHPMKDASKTIELKPGLHRVWLEYFNAGPPMGLNVFMKVKDGQKIPIPEDRLLHDPAEALNPGPSLARH